MKNPNKRLLKISLRFNFAEVFLIFGIQNRFSMDILRKELNRIYEAQNLEGQLLEASQVAETGNVARILAQTSGGCTVVTDASCDRCFIHAAGLGRLIGLTDDATLYHEVDSSDEDEIYNRMHPEDLVEKRMLEYEFFKRVHTMAPEEKTLCKATCRIRMKDRDGSYRMIDNSTQVVRQSPSGTIWLILCCYNLTPDAARGEGIEPHIVNSLTGEITALSFREKKMHVLTEREKEILRLIQGGKASKQIADMLGISVHTVNRHRQNIIGKLSVGNSIEAITAAQAMKLL